MQLLGTQAEEKVHGTTAPQERSQERRGWNPNVQGLTQKQRKLTLTPRLEATDNLQGAGLSIFKFMGARKTKPGLKRSQVWRFAYVILALKRLRQEHLLCSKFWGWEMRRKKYAGKRKNRIHRQIEV